MKGHNDNEHKLNNDAIEPETNESPEDTEEPTKPEQEAVAAKEKTLAEVEKEYQDKIKQMEDRFLRLAAEFDNYKKRTARQFEDIIKTANERLIVQLLDVADNFHRALEAARNSSDYDSLRKGTELIWQHLEDILKKEGLEKIEALGKEFDPQVHDAMMQIESEEHPEGTVALEVSPGYKLSGKIIRHSKVAVSKGNSSAEKDELDAEDQDAD